MKTLTLIVTYNEVDNITRLVTQILIHVPASSVLVVDDNSPDGTARAVQALADHDNRVSVICRTTERGYGSAMIAGLRYGIENGFDSILTLDADFSHDPADLPRILAGLEDADVAVGSRYAGGVRVLNWEVRRLLLSLAANTYVRLLSGLECFDCTSGFRGYRASVLDRVALTKMRTTGYAFLPELLFNMGPRPGDRSAHLLYRAAPRRIKNVQRGDRGGAGASVGALRAQARPAAPSTAVMTP